MLRKIITTLGIFLTIITIFLILYPFSFVASYTIRFDFEFEKESMYIVAPENKNIAEKVYPGQVLQFNETLFSIYNPNPYYIMIFMDFSVLRTGIASTIGSYKFEVYGNSRIIRIDPREDIIILRIPPGGFVNVSFIYSIAVPHNYTTNSYKGTFIVQLDRLSKIPIIVRYLPV